MAAPSRGRGGWPLCKKLGPWREAWCLNEYFERKGRQEGVAYSEQFVWGKEPFEFRRYFDAHLHKNVLVHKECKDFMVFNGYIDLVNVMDKRYPADKNNVVLYYWTKKANLEKMSKPKDGFSTELTRTGAENLWSDIILKNCKVYQEEMTAESSKGGSNFDTSSMNRTGSSFTRSQTSMSSLSQNNKPPGTAQTGSGSSADRAASAGAKSRGGNTSSSSGSRFRKKQYRSFAGEFSSVQPDDFYKRAVKKEVTPFEDGTHPAKVFLVEFMTGMTYRDALREGLVENFEIAIPVWVPFRFVAPSRDSHGCENYPWIVNIDVTSYSTVPEEWWNDRLVDACAAGDVAKVDQCFQNGANVNHADFRGVTPLHAISNILHNRAFMDEENRKKKILNLLLAKKANIHALTLRGEKPLALAEARGFSMCADLLRAEQLAKLHEEKHYEQIPDPPLVVALREKLLL